MLLMQIFLSLSRYTHTHTAKVVTDKLCLTVWMTSPVVPYGRLSGQTVYIYFSPDVDITPALLKVFGDIPQSNVSKSVSSVSTSNAFLNFTLSASLIHMGCQVQYAVFHYASWALCKKSIEWRKWRIIAFCGICWKLVNIFFFKRNG